MSENIRICEVCGRTELETKIYNAVKYDMVLCKKHYLQMWRNGRILERTIYDPNETRTEGVCSFIYLYDVKGNKIGEAIIDTKHLRKCKELKWYLAPNGYVRGGLGGGKKIMLHNYIHILELGHEIEKDLLLDHDDGNPLNNVMTNLYPKTHQENAFNMHKDGKTIGVNYNLWNGVYKWIPRLMINGKNIWLGAYDTEEEAIKVRLEAVEKYFQPDKFKSIAEISAELRDEKEK